MTPEGSRAIPSTGPAPQEHLVARGTVFRAEAVHCRAKAPRARAVEIRNLHNPHALIRVARVFRSTTDINQ